MDAEEPHRIASCPCTEKILSIFNVTFNVVDARNNVTLLANVMVVFVAQNSSSQLTPIAQALHVQTFGSEQLPFPLQTLAEDATYKKNEKLQIAYHSMANGKLTIITTVLRRICANAQIWTNACTFAVTNSTK